MLGDLLDRIAAIEQHTFVAVNIGDLRFATRRRGETRIVGEHSGLGIELADIENRRTDCSWTVEFRWLKEPVVAKWHSSRHQSPARDACAHSGHVHETQTRLSPAWHQERINETHEHERLLHPIWSIESMFGHETTPCFAAGLVSASFG